MSNPLLSVLNKKPAGRPPFWFMRQAGRYLPEYRAMRAKHSGFLDLCYTPEAAAEVTLQPVRRFGMDAAILFSDILVVPHALGCDLRFVEGEGPKLKPVISADELSLARVEGHIQPVLETVRRVRAELPAGVALIGFAGSPWTVACYMIEGGGSREFEKARAFAIAKREQFAAIINVLEAATVLYLKAQIAAGAQVIQLFDSWAGILPPHEFARWVAAPTARIVAELKKAFPEVPVIGFPRMAGAKYAEYAQKTGVDAVSVDPTVDMGWAAENIPAVLQGNLDPVLLLHDLPGALDYAKKLRETMQGRPFIFNLGHGMLPKTPVEHVQALSDFLRAS